MKKGYAMLVLHTHIPFVKRSGRWPFGEEWLYEALAFSYVPLVRALEELSKEGVSFKVTVGITPVLMEQLADREMCENFVEYLDTRIDFATWDEDKFEKRGEQRLADLARFWREYFGEVREYFEEIGGDLLAQLRKLQDAGYVEVITAPATHPYLPLLGEEESIWLQFKVGVETYRKHMKTDPKGVWLPECGYRPRTKTLATGRTYSYERPGIDEFLPFLGIRYFFVDSHSIEGGLPGEKKIGIYDWGQAKPARRVYYPARNKTTYRAYVLEKSEVVVFGRNRETGLQVWSADVGYPGDPNYLEFHKKDMDSGLRYWRVTDRRKDLAEKDVYDLSLARKSVQSHVSHFCWLVENLISEFHEKENKRGAIVAMYDTELFGHWWFEGVSWLKETLRRLSTSSVVELSTPSHYLEREVVNETINIPESSWGMGGWHEVWLNDKTRWMWELIYHREEEAKLAAQIVRRKPEFKNIFAQMLRELLLLEASDWEFLITTGAAPRYAERRFIEHAARFLRLFEILDRGRFMPEDSKTLADIFNKGRIFDTLDISWFESVPEPLIAGRKP